MRISAIAPRRPSIFARAVEIATSRAFTPVLGQLPLYSLQAQSVLRGGAAVARLEQRGGLGLKVVLIGLQLADLPHEALSEPGVGGETLVEAADLLAEVFLLQLQQRFRILPLDAADEDIEKGPKQIGDAPKHELPLPSL
jgi:hypothetical protein